MDELDLSEYKRIENFRGRAYDVAGAIAFDIETEGRGVHRLTCLVSDIGKFIASLAKFGAAAAEHSSQSEKEEHAEPRQTILSPIPTYGLALLGGAKPDEQLLVVNLGTTNLSFRIDENQCRQLSDLLAERGSGPKVRQT